MTSVRKGAYADHPLVGKPLANYRSSSARSQHHSPDAEPIMTCDNVTGYNQIETLRRLRIRSPPRCQHDVAQPEVGPIARPSRGRSRAGAVRHRPHPSPEQPQRATRVHDRPPLSASHQAHYRVDRVWYTAPTTFRTKRGRVPCTDSCRPDRGNVGRGERRQGQLGRLREALAGRACSDPSPNEGALRRASQAPHPSGSGRCRARQDLARPSSLVALAAGWRRPSRIVDNGQVLSPPAR